MVMIHKNPWKFLRIEMASIHEGLLLMRSQNGKFSKKWNAYLMDFLWSTLQKKSEGTIWVGTDMDGINAVNKKDFSVHYILYNGEDKNSQVYNIIFGFG